MNNANAHYFHHTHAEPTAQQKLMYHAIDKAEDVATTQRAFEALERLITPCGELSVEALDVERSDLGALLRVLNTAMRAEVQAMTDAYSAVARSLSA